MNPDIKRKWIDALLSGEYKQGSSRMSLSWGDGARLYCCLGVLCEVLGLQAREEKGEGCGPSGPRVVYVYDGKIMIPSDGALLQAGLDRGDAMALATKNDSGASFTEIAGIIGRLP